MIDIVGNHYNNHNDNDDDNGNDNYAIPTRSVEVAPIPELNRAESS